ncbi:MAG: hypothetical protein QMD71_01895 [bacterium]|nr:hypothetical protein [bacterium]
MKKVLFALLLMLFTFNFTIKSYAIPNHNAVLICGETADKLADTTWEWGGIGERIKSGEAEPQPMKEFWLDTYLMWELLFDNSHYKLYCPDPEAEDAYKYDHIHVLYGEGEDWDDPYYNKRYIEAKNNGVKSDFFSQEFRAKIKMKK